LRCANFTLTNTGATFKHFHCFFALLLCNYEVHQRLQSIIANLIHESDYVKDRLMTADSVEEILVVIRMGEQAALD
jgi:hypothetical protein